MGHSLLLWIQCDLGQVYNLFEIFSLFIYQMVKITVPNWPSTSQDRKIKIINSYNATEGPRNRSLNVPTIAYETAPPLYCSGNYSTQTLSSSSQASNIWIHICWLTSPDNFQHSPKNTNWNCLLPATPTANVLSSGPGVFHIHSIPGTDLTGPEFLPSSVSSTLLPKPLTYKAIMPFLSLRIFAGSKVGCGPLTHHSASKASSTLAPPLSPVWANLLQFQDSLGLLSTISPTGQNSSVVHKAFPSCWNFYNSTEPAPRLCPYSYPHTSITVLHSPNYDLSMVTNKRTPLKPCLTADSLLYLA